MNPYMHKAPDKEAIKRNKVTEFEGERIRTELQEFLERNKIVCIRLDTDKLCVDIQSAKQPDNIKCVLTKWGCIYVLDENT